jgi:hypothetical protein
MNDFPLCAVPPLQKFSPRGDQKVTKNRSRNGKI